MVLCVWSLLLHFAHFCCLVCVFLIPNWHCEERPRNRNTGHPSRHVGAATSIGRPQALGGHNHWACLGVLACHRTELTYDWQV